MRRSKGVRASIATRRCSPRLSSLPLGSLRGFFWPVLTVAGYGDGTVFGSVSSEQ